MSNTNENPIIAHLPGGYGVRASTAHDPHSGRFTSGAGSSGASIAHHSAALEKAHAALKASHSTPSAKAHQASVDAHEASLKAHSTNRAMDHHEAFAKHVNAMNLHKALTSSEIPKHLQGHQFFGTSHNPANAHQQAEHKLLQTQHQAAVEAHSHAATVPTHKAHAKYAAGLKKRLTDGEHPSHEEHQVLKYHK